jgi:hypothetical protein
MCEVYVCEVYVGWCMRDIRCRVVCVVMQHGGRQSKLRCAYSIYSSFTMDLHLILPTTRARTTSLTPDVPCFEAVAAADARESEAKLDIEEPFVTHGDDVVFPPHDAHRNVVRRGRVSCQLDLVAPAAVEHLRCGVDGWMGGPMGSNCGRGGGVQRCLYAVGSVGTHHAVRVCVCACVYVIYSSIDFAIVSVFLFRPLPPPSPHLLRPPPSSQ